MSHETRLLTRRSAIKRLVAMLGGTMTAAQLGLLTQRAEAIAADRELLFFDEQQFAMLSRIADLIIPETDTPGALGAGVPQFIDLMLAEWASEARQIEWADGLASIDDRSQAAGLPDFSAGSKEQQIELLRELDHEFFEGDDKVTFFSRLKRMVLFSYYSTEIGSTVELRYLPIPGDYLPCIPLQDGDHAWFWNGYSYGL